MTLFHNLDTLLGYQCWIKSFSWYRFSYTPFSSICKDSCDHFGLMNIIQHNLCVKLSWLANNSVCYLDFLLPCDLTAILKNYHLWECIILPLTVIIYYPFLWIIKIFKDMYFYDYKDFFFYNFISLQTLFLGFNFRIILTSWNKFGSILPPAFLKTILYKSGIISSLTVWYNLAGKPFWTAFCMCAHLFLTISSNCWPYRELFK